MKQRPILFNSAMVRALLDGSKTQTRRVMKEQPYSNGFMSGNEMLCYNDYLPPSVMLLDTKHGYTTSNVEGWESECPHGQVGDQLWVREAFSAMGDADKHTARIFYRADGEDGNPWTPSIHMPRWASRITLEITGVRLECLQDISEEDAKAEGAIGGHGAIPNYQYAATPIEHFKHIWESTGGDWEANPWVWVIEFKRVEQ